MPTAVPITAVPVTSQGAARRADPAGLLRSILILAVTSFVIGFVGFLAMNGAQLRGVAAPEQTAAADALPAQAAEPTPAPAALPASDDWNLPKAI